MQTIESYEIITVQSGQQVILTHNDQSIYEDYQGKTLGGKQEKKDLLVYAYVDNKEIQVALYKNFNFLKVKLMEHVKAAEISHKGEVVSAIKILLGKHAESLFTPDNVATDRLIGQA